MLVDLFTCRTKSFWVVGRDTFKWIGKKCINLSIIESSSKSKYTKLFYSYTHDDFCGS